MARLHLEVFSKNFFDGFSFGRVRDLDKGDKAIDIENDFTPKYVVTPEKQKVVKELKAAAKKVDEVWLATDEDREGEAISWHLCQVLGLDEATTKRIVFREITKPAIQKAVTQPRTVDIDLVNAQQARRILDRLVGFELSGILWRKVRAKLSAGRVQSVTVKLVVERERDIQAFDPKPYYKVVARFNVKNEQGRNVVLKADLASRFEAEADAQSFLDRCVAATYQINDIVVKPTKRRPTAPFTTSTLQQEASRKLGFSVRRTMSNAQRLYEQGLITYMRTDSVALSETALSAIADEITTSYGKEYVHTRRFKGKKELAQEAHEAIRPSYIDRKVVTQDRDQQRLYELIWKRTIASQMADAELEKTTVSIGISTVPDAKLVALGEVLKFD
ncbi:MAG: DNA topoisomerase, partial [Bacteroidota bacterium]